PQTTADLTSELIRWLKTRLAPTISIHGVLVDVYGEGVLILGDSGVGKSEAALELIKRGHRLVADDVVELRRISEVSLIGRAPSITKHFIELRGIGIIDVKALFGAECVKDVQTVDLVIKLEEWDKNRDYDRLGMDDQYTEFLRVQVVCNTLPIRPGRNLAIICETAAVNRRQKKMGYNAAKELYRRVTDNMIKSAERHERERHEEELIAERRRIGEELNHQVKEKILGHLETIDTTDLPEHYGEFERNLSRIETDSADMDQMS
ncbi:MAG: HPr(Ser) kinase/phosphatase, partial [Lachnospiraceae bacterium]